MNSPRFQQIKEHAHLVRDNRSGAVLSTDMAAVTAVRMRKQKRRKEKKTISEMQQKINTMEESMARQEKMLMVLINRNNESNN